MIMKYILNGLFVVLMFLCVIAFIFCMLVGGVLRLLGNFMIAFGKKLMGLEDEEY